MSEGSRAGKSDSGVRGVDWLTESMLRLSDERDTDVLLIAIGCLTVVNDYQR